MNIKINPTYCWILLIPMTFLNTFLVWVILILVSRLSGFPPSKANLYFWFILGGILMAFTWVSTSYFIAPFHKQKTIWTSYFIGLLFLVVTGFEGIIKFIEDLYVTVWIAANIAAIATGLITSLNYQYKNH